MDGFVLVAVGLVESSRAGHLQGSKCWSVVKARCQRINVERCIIHLSVAGKKFVSLYVPFCRR